MGEVISSISIDRIALSVPLAEKGGMSDPEHLHHQESINYAHEPDMTMADPQHIRECIWAVKGEPGCKVIKKQYHTTASIGLNAGRSFRLTAGVAYKKQYAKIEFVSSTFDAESWELLRSHLEYILPLGYSTLFYDCKVTYLEIALDFKGVKWPGLLPFDSHAKNSKWEPNPDSPKPTAYLGHRASNRVIHVYDRVERLKKKKIALDGPVTRIEAKLRKLNCSISTLNLIENPFLSFGICNFGEAESTWSLPSWKKFMIDCRNDGAPIALSKAAPNQKAFLQKLGSLTCEWWNPEVHWSGYTTALSVFK